MNKSRLIYSHRADSHVHVCTCTYNILNMNIYTCIRTCNILKMPLLIYKREEGFIFISETPRISMFACPFSLGTASVLLRHYYDILSLQPTYQKFYSPS